MKKLTEDITHHSVTTQIVYNPILPGSTTVNYIIPIFYQTFPVEKCGSKYNKISERNLTFE